MPPLETARSKLLPLSLAMLEARCHSAALLEPLLGVAVPESFPLPDTLELFRQTAGVVVADPSRAGDWGAYLVIHHAQVVGLTGFKGPPLAGEVELFYELIPQARGQGLCTEAVTALCNWALAGGATRVIAKIEPQNLASRRVLERSGFQPFAAHDPRFAWFALI